MPIANTFWPYNHQGKAGRRAGANIGFLIDFTFVPNCEPTNEAVHTAKRNGRNRVSGLHKKANAPGV